MRLACFSLACVLILFASLARAQQKPALPDACTQFKQQMASPTSASGWPEEIDQQRPSPPGTLTSLKQFAQRKPSSANALGLAEFFAIRKTSLPDASGLTNQFAQQKPVLPNASGLPKPLAQSPTNPPKPPAPGEGAQPHPAGANAAAQAHPGAAKTPPEHPSKIHLEPVHASTAWNSADRIIQGAVALLPKVILAAAVFILFVIVARLIRWGIRRLGEKRGIRRNAATLLAKLVQLGILIVGLMAALSIVAPSFTLSDLIKMLGIGGVAIGFAFKDILQNFLAGILLLVNEPFQIGDQISVVGMEGAVDEIQTRATLITTPDGDRVVMPNSTIFTNPVTVRKQKSGVLAEREQDEKQRREQGGKK